MQTNHLCWNQTNEAIWELRSNSLLNLLACWAEILLDIIVKIPSKVHFNWASSCMATIRSSGTITVLAKYISQPQNPQSDHTSLLQKWQHLDSIWNICYPIKHPFAAGVHDCPLAQGPELASYTTNYCEGGVNLSMCRAVEADHCNITSWVLLDPGERTISGFCGCFSFLFNSYVNFPSIFIFILLPE